MGARTRDPWFADAATWTPSIERYQQQHEVARGLGPARLYLPNVAMLPPGDEVFLDGDTVLSHLRWCKEHRVRTEVGFLAMEPHEITGHVVWHPHLEMVNVSYIDELVPIAVVASAGGDRVFMLPIDSVISLCIETTSPIPPTESD